MKFQELISYIDYNKYIKYFTVTSILKLLLANHKCSSLYSYPNNFSSIMIGKEIFY